MIIGILLLLQSVVGSAAPKELEGQWFEAPEHWHYQQQPDLNKTSLLKVDATKNTGGHFFYQSDFSLQADAASIGAAENQPQTMVIDFKNTSVIGRFHHYVFDGRGHLLTEVSGGIQSHETNPFMLRHGRELKLPAGRYRIITEISSPFFIARPQPYVNAMEDYRQSINPGNALLLFCLGGMLTLAIYYLALSLVRRQLSDAMYGIFIVMNFIFNCMAMLVFSDFFGVHWFYLIGLPILFSNIAYVLFVTALLGINPQSYPKLYKARGLLIALLILFVLLALIIPHMSLEFERYGVAIILMYSLGAGVTAAYKGNRLAYMYLIAICAFFLIGSFTIANSQLNGIYTIYIEHFGVVSVTVEMILLALVLSRQFAQLHSEKEDALNMLRKSLQIAHTDVLTGLPNRHPLDQALESMPEPGMLVFMDMNGLKYYNDHFGHQSGDKLLCSFANILKDELRGKGVLYRIGGDEFAITYPSGDEYSLLSILGQTVIKLRQQGFEFAGISHGLAYVSENPDKNILKHLADTRMYEHKRSTKQKAPLTANALSAAGTTEILPNG